MTDAPPALPQAQSQAPVPAPQPPPATHPQTSATPGSQIKLLSQPELKLQFGRLNSTRRRITWQVDPAALTRVFQKEFRVLVNCLGGLIAPAITEDQYLQMTRTLVLKRLQDISEYQTGIRPNPCLAMSRSLNIPQPLGELLYALGPYYSNVHGRDYYPVAPARPAAAVPAWMNLDANILSDYRLLMDQVKSRYQTVPFPKMSDMNGQPLIFTISSEANDMNTVRASINTPQPSDAFLRFVHETDFIATNAPTFNHCDLIMTETLFIEDVVDNYVRSYVMSVHG